MSLAILRLRSMKRFCQAVIGSDTDDLQRLSELFASSVLSVVEIWGMILLFGFDSSNARA